MKVKMNIIYPAFALFAFACFAASATAQFCVGSATWLQSPVDGEWGRCENWTTQTVPNGPGDVATFSASSVTTINGGYGLPTLDSLVFDSTAGSYTITQELQIVGAGVFNNSSATQYIPGGGPALFYNSATASGSGGTVVYPGGAEFFNTATATNAIFPNGFANFNDNSSAGTGTFTMLRSVSDFFGSSTAANGVFTCNGDTVTPPSPGAVIFYDNSNAGNGTFTANGATVVDGGGGHVDFWGTSSAANATLIANGGVTDADAGHIIFANGSSGLPSGGFARVEVFDNGYLEINAAGTTGISIGSLEGTGKVNLDNGPSTGSTLMVGSNNLSTTFSGVIQDSAFPGGSLAKIGTGTLTLSGANTYTGGTTIESGTLLAAATGGSATGPGAVRVNGGTFGGTGRISGAIIVGTGTGSGSVLAPGINGPGVLGARKTLTFNADSTYSCEVATRNRRSDQVSAKGVTINNGATFTFVSIGNRAIPSGTVFTVINNTAATPISGTFGDLADASTFTVGPNTYLVNYEGGTGNDLTLTVQ